MLQIITKTYNQSCVLQGSISISLISQKTNKKMLRTTYLWRITLRPCKSRSDAAGWVQRVRNKEDWSGLIFLRSVVWSGLIDFGRILYREVVIEKAASLAYGVCGQALESNRRSQKMIKNAKLGRLRNKGFQSWNSLMYQGSTFIIEDETDGGEELRMKYRYFRSARNDPAWEEKSANSAPMNAKGLENNGWQDFMGIENPCFD